MRASRSALFGAIFPGIALLLAFGIVAAGCERRPEVKATAPAAADTLANGLPRALAPQLDAWLQNWRRAVPGLALDSLACVARGPYRFASASPAGGRRFADGVRSRAMIEVLSPDSTRLLDYDRYADVDSESGSLEREADSAPMLLDMALDTLWTVSFCGPGCFYDGGFWLDASSFVLTGATQSGEQVDGPWQGFVEVYDLGTRERIRWAMRPMDDGSFERYRAVSDSLLLARFAQSRLTTASVADPGARASSPDR